MTRRERVFRPDEHSIGVCLYAQRECKKPGEIECPLTVKLRKITDVRKWQRTALKANECEHIGEDLTIKQYNAKKRGARV